jgi:hypothetical protein
MIAMFGYISSSPTNLAKWWRYSTRINYSGYSGSGTNVSFPFPDKSGRHLFFRPNLRARDDVATVLVLYAPTVM